MDLHQMRYVVAVADEGSFTRAAARCFVAQSGLSQRIKSLEDELGVALFHRTSRRVQLTPAGEAFLPHARASLRSAERAASDSAAAAGVIQGRLGVGVIPTVTAVDVSAALKAFRHAYPRVHIALQVAGSGDLEEAIAQGEIDVALLGLPESREPSGVAWRHLGSDRLVAIVSKNHRLAGRQQVTLADLAPETFADFPQGTPARAESDIAFDAAGIHREVAFESMATDLTIDLIRHELAVALLPAKYGPRDPRLAHLPIVDGPSRSEYLAWSAFAPSPAAHAFLEIVVAAHRRNAVGNAPAED